MDNTVVANALPTIMSDLDMSNSAKDWVATGYILMFSCLMVAGGRLTDVFGCRVTFVSGMVVFTAASAVCGLAPDSATLILARVAQGAGAALALPATQVMVTVGRTDKQRSLGTIVWVGAGSSATALGPTIGGFIVQQWSWGWIFLINIVPGILVILLGLVVLTGKGENRDARVDLPGVLISATMLFAFTYGLESGNKHGWADPSVLSVFALAFIALACFILVESWAPDPMINLRFFRNRVFAGGLLSQMLYGIGFNGMIFYSATFLQRFLGFSPPQAGLVMLPPSIAIMVMTPVAFWLAAKLGPRPAIGGGLALMAFGMFLFSTIQQGDGYADLMPGVMIVGVGAAMGMPLVMYVLKAVPEQQAGVASGIINVIREASGAFGIAIVGLLIHHVPDEGASAAELETFRSGTASGLILGAVLVLIGGLISGLTLPSRRGWLGPKHGKSSPLVEPTPRRPEAPPRDPVPALTAPVAVATPPGEPLPLPLTWEEDPMPDPTPGPHWWTDTPPKPQDDTYTWTTETPWPPPPPTPNPWKDWPTPTDPPPGTPTAPPPTTAAESPPTAGPPPANKPPSDTPPTPPPLNFPPITPPAPPPQRNLPHPPAPKPSGGAAPPLNEPPGNLTAPGGQAEPLHSPSPGPRDASETAEASDSPGHEWAPPRESTPGTVAPGDRPLDNGSAPRPSAAEQEHKPASPHLEHAAKHPKKDPGQEAAPGQPTEGIKSPLLDNSRTAAEGTEKTPTDSTTASHYKHPTAPGEPTAPAESSEHRPDTPQTTAGGAATRPPEATKRPPHKPPTTPTEGGEASLTHSSGTTAGSTGNPPTESTTGPGYKHPAAPCEGADPGASSEHRLDSNPQTTAGVAATRPAEDVKTPPDERPTTPPEGGKTPFSGNSGAAAESTGQPPTGSTAAPSYEHPTAPRYGHPAEPGEGADLGESGEQWLDGPEANAGVAAGRTAEGAEAALGGRSIDLPEAASPEMGDGLLGGGSEGGAGDTESLLDGGSAGAGEADGGSGGRPAPPEGWYEPYVPEEEPAEKPHIVPRSDAW
ncbi:DHA2 family efflux MFS transporter permease subunit [Actinomadura luteofluorescens]|uniref:DHA2 family efflux MFS transporter permease subunit n=1 Tax=Actinomadura luteofluorescens TaxID=46163 RepID=UPI003D8F93B0